MKIKVELWLSKENYENISSPPPLYNIFYRRKTTLSDAISLKNQYGKILASSREVAEKFGKRNPDVNRAIGNLIVQNCTVKDMFIISSYTSSRGREEIEYLMDRDGFSLLVMGFNGKKALEWKLKYIEAFNSMEKMLRELSEPQDSYLIEDPAARARRWAEEYEEKQRIEHENVKLLEVNDQLQTENDEMRPKAKFHDDIQASENSITLGVFSAILQNNHNIKFGQNRLFKWCREHGILCSEKKCWNKPQQKMLDAGYFQVKETVYVNKDGSVYSSYTPLLTGKGQVWLTNKILKEFEK